MENIERSVKIEPFVSVIMPAYNCGKFIKESIDSILNQTYSNFELLIADDASTDYTKLIIAEYKDSRIKVFHNEFNQGYLKNWNKLIQKAQGQYITFMDADDYADENRIYLLVNELEGNNSIDICGSNYTRVTEKGELGEVSDFPAESELIFNAMPNTYFFIGSALMIRRRVYDEIGGYHEFFDRMGQEDHYWIYLCLEKFKMTNIPESLYFYRFNPASVSGNLSNNPSKINSGEILNFLIQQRKTKGEDWLSQKRESELQKKLVELNLPFVKDSSYFYYYLAKRRFYEGHKRIAIKYMLRTISRRPFKISHYRDLGFFIRSKKH
jgi:glycosyltransferase involved in cell wall biosynthesis